MVAERLHSIVVSEEIDFVIANGENAAGGFGITPQIADELLALGVDVLTSGNHIWDKRDIYEYLAKPGSLLLRPANYPPDCPGRGLTVLTARNGLKVAVINLQGRVHMPATDCPFRTMDTLLAELDPAVRIRFVDFHAEVTSEKVAMGWYLDGRVTALVGTHTHIPTADARVLPNGAAYQTDCGMTGPYDSVIGVEKDPIIRKFITSLPVRMEAARERVELNAVIVAVDTASGRARSIRRYVTSHQG